jgi:hypothetical protein
MQIKMAELLRSTEKKIELGFAIRYHFIRNSSEIRKKVVDDSKIS